MRKILAILIILQLLSVNMKAQEWVVPDDRKGRLSTFPFDDNTRSSGQKIYNLNCMSCHGTPGKSNYLNLVPPPGDPATDKIQHNSDGEMFYKVQSGRGQMPSFRSVLTSDELWQVVSYIRSFNKSYKQQFRAVISSSAYPGATINMTLALNEPDSTFILTAWADRETGRVPVTDAGVRIFIHRTFGHQAVDEEKITDKTGKAVFKIPLKLNGDSLGNVTVSARFVDEDTFGTASKDTVLAAGIRTYPVSLVKERAMWNKASKAPLWIMLSYILGVLIAWSFIIIVLLKIRDIYITGKYIESAESEKQNN
ncbi:MAG TPA: cytochrome c [Bacteroidales bacterium]|nr:cytochrome c [Bacteroidales bacterium]